MPSRHSTNWRSPCKLQPASRPTGQLGPRALLLERLHLTALAEGWFPLRTRRQRVALCRCYFVLNRRAGGFGVADRARSKPGSACGGTRYCRAIQPIACAAAGVKCLGWAKLLSLVTFFAAAKKVTPAPGRGNTNRPKRKQDFIEAQANKTKQKPHEKKKLRPPP